MLRILGISVLALAVIYLLALIQQGWKLRRQFDAHHALKSKLMQQQVAALIAHFDKQETQLDSWSGWRKFRVARIKEENATIKSYYLTSHDGKDVAQFLPGQHLTFRLKVPGKSKPVIRCYSLSDDANRTDRYRVSIRRQAAPMGSTDIPDGVSSCFFHDELVQGSVLDVRAPNGKFYLDTLEQTPIVLVAGGIGLTPSLSMINTLYKMESDRSIDLFFAVRTADDLIMQERFNWLTRKMSNFRVHYFIFDLADEGVGNDRYNGYLSVERMFRTLSEIVNPADVDFYVCGPPPMMDAIVGGLGESGIDSQRIHFESFGPTSVSKSSVPVSELSKTHMVDVQVSGKSVKWSVDSGTLLDAAEDAGVPMESGCRAGSCGTCLTAILEGEVEYIDEAGTDIEEGSCLPCIAIPRTNLKLNT